MSIPSELYEFVCILSDDKISVTTLGFCVVVIPK